MIGVAIMNNKDYILKLIYDNYTKIGIWVTILVIIGSIISGDIFYSTIIGTIFYCMVILNRRTNVKEEEIKNKVYDANVPLALDKIINDAFDEYLILNRGYKDEDVPINSTEEKQIVMTLIDSVSARISDEMNIKLSLFYNKSAVPDIISTKIYMSVLAYVIEHNKPKDDLSPITNKNKESIVKYL